MSQEMKTNPAVDIISTLDSRGRRLIVRQTTAVDLFDANVILGAFASNGTLLVQAVGAAAVVELDGNQWGPIENIVDLRARISALGLDGLTAIGRALAFMAANRPGESIPDRPDATVPDEAPQPSVT